MSGDFSGHPPTIGEIRVDREDDCRAWSPRDALISLLRDIDDGKVDVTDLIVVYRERVKQPKPGYEAYNTRFVLAASDGGGVMAMGMMQRVAFMMNQASCP